MLIPLIIFFNLKFNTINAKKSLPIFILFFFVAVIYSNLINLSYEVIEYLKILSKIFISYGIFSIGLQSGKLDLSDIKPKPFMVATSVWIIVVPVAYLISIN